jgi:uncharacterized lipoprotein YajG
MGIKRRNMKRTLFSVFLILLFAACAAPETEGQTEAPIGLEPAATATVEDASLAPLSALRLKAHPCLTKLMPR